MRTIDRRRFGKHKSGVKFSVCLIARNEAPNMWRLHKSLHEFLERGGEVILVDTGSTDNTVEVARQYGFKVFEEGNRFKHIIDEDTAKKINEKFIVEGEQEIIKAGDQLFDFAAARNCSVGHANNDIVSVVDCDEQYTALDIDAIEKLIDQGYEQMEMHFIFARYPSGEPAVQFRHCRTYDRRKMHWTGIVHEILTGQAKCTYLPQDVMLVEHHQAPHTRRSSYLPALALDCYLNPENDRNSHYFGRELVWSGRNRSAIKELTRHVAMNRWPQERSESMIFIGDAHLAIGEDEKALEWFHRAFTIDGTRRIPFIKLAQYFYRKGDPQKTICYCMAALEIPPNDCYCNIGAHYTFEPHEMLYWAFWQLGQKEKAKEHWEKAIGYDPNNPKYIADKIWFVTKLSNPEPIKEGQIPKRIFTIWLSDNEMPDVVKKSIISQRAVSGYTHEVITLNNCLRGIKYVEDAIEAKCWVKASDYLRLLELKERGGIYCDADTEILPGKNFDQLLDYSLFACQEWNCFIANSIIGARPGHPIIRECLEEMEEKFKGNDEYIFQSAQEIMTPKIYFRAYGDSRCLWLAPGKLPNDASIKILSPDYFFPYNHESGAIDVTGNTIGFHHFMTLWKQNTLNLLPKIGILIPVLGTREAGLRRCLESIDKLYYPKHLIKIIIDSDPDPTVPQKTNRMYRQNSDCDAYVFASDDVEFEPWSLYNAAKELPRHGLVTFNTGELYPDKSNICEHFLIRKDFADKLGEIFSEKFFHVGPDNLLWAKATRKGEGFRCENAKIIHHHFSRNPALMDETYQRAWSHMNEDRAILKQELAKLECST